MPLPARIVAIAGLSVAITACSTAAEPPPGTTPVTTIQSLDVQRYMGKWHEIAKYPNRFQAKCVSDTSADYSLQPDGTVKVVNRCRLANGEMDEAVGTARQIGEATSPKLKVRFAPAWLSWLPAVWGDYWVIDLDPAYQLAAVSDPRREYLWVLSRTPQVDPPAYQALLGRLQARGFDLSKLEMSKADMPNAR